jgi:pyruvate dehydrogenase E1 component
LRLSTKPIDQSLIETAIARLGKDRIREQALNGGYVLRAGAGDQNAPHLLLVTSGAMVPEAMEAANLLEREGVITHVIHLTNPRRAYENRAHMTALLSAAPAGTPILTVHDAASHALSWIGGLHGQRSVSLGADKFGQCGYRQDLYRYMGIDAISISAAGFALLD